MTRIGGLVAKATAARNRGADVLLFPAVQAHELEDFRPGRMRLLPVASLDEAIQLLEATTPRGTGCRSTERVRRDRAARTAII